MDIDNLPGNTQYAQKKEKEKAKPVISNKDLVQKDSISKIKDFIFDDDVVNEVIMPGIGNMILDGLEMIFFHNGNRRSRRKEYDDNPSYRYDSHYRYGNNRYSSSNRSRDSYDSDDSGQFDRNNNRVDFRNIIVRHRDDAEKLVYEMHIRIKEYGSVSIADLLDLIDTTGEYTDNEWGWTNPRDISYRRVARGFLIDLAEPRPLR